MWTTPECVHDSVRKDDVILFFYWLTLVEMWTSDFKRLGNFMLWSVTERVIMAQNVFVVSLRLNNALTLGNPVAYGERDPRSQLMVAGSEELQANPGCPTHSCCPEMAAEGHSQARERCRRTCLHLAPSSPEQEPLWVGLWTGTGRGSGVIALCTLPEQLFPISSGGKGLWTRQKRPPAAWVWPADPSWSLLDWPIHALTVLIIICFCKIYTF